ncbi:hypothetical protein [Virgisporangium aurantiacum]|uniref:Uncharacterized protein n=1 Tax=Virgisporangium aurantiacum TaxID=175570 RepID=A0A8J4E343_9ACTN|nr:hypothetical protein [Virgisporangium aurantiacum]GIJ59563.1 hypothetical protein Vau01_070790 [Virgisporangium aurantiacum]
MSFYRALRRPAVVVTAFAAAVSATVLAATGSPASAATGAFSFTKVEGAAGDVAGLTPTVKAFQGLLGDPNNASNPPAQNGRREINWDGTPDAQSAPNLLPPDFFNTTVPRGAVFVSKNNKFSVSADDDNPTNTPPRFADINPQYDDIFATFSPQRLFTPLGTNVMGVRFFVPGTNKPATVKGFGAVFTDVDRANVTKLELLDRYGKRLFVAYAPKATIGDKGLSFVGVQTNADVYEVRITTGNAALGKNVKDDKKRDLVVMDDLLYAEPDALR